jgi:hypothetical protein
VRSSIQIVQAHTSVEHHEDHAYCCGAGEATGVVLPIHLVTTASQHRSTRAAHNIHNYRYLLLSLTWKRHWAAAVRCQQ